MDISSLLSPQDSPATETPPALPPEATRSPAKRTRRQMPSRTPSAINQQSHYTQRAHHNPQVTSSPQHFHPESLPSHAAPSYHHHPAGPPAHSGHGLAHYTNGRPGGVHSGLGTPTYDRGSPHEPRVTPPHHLHRQTSTPGMDALADLASMQHVQQTARQQSTSQRPSISLQNIPRTISGDSTVSMRTELSPRPARVFVSNALDTASLDVLNQLERALLENPLDYYSYVNFISILHQGLQNVLASNNSLQAARTYDLLPVLRDAYEAMASKYALGERLWEFRIHDEKVLAQSFEERVSVLEMCEKAVNEEPFSAKLWVLYGDYASYLVACTWDPSAPEHWSEQETPFARELLTVDMLLEIWQRGAEFVKFDVSDSGLVWDRYLQALMDDLERRYNPDKLKRVATIFNDRLNQAHATSDETMAKYSSFNSRYHQSNYEAIMEYAVSQLARVKKVYAHRKRFEFDLLTAIQSGDQAAEYTSLSKYLEWEKKRVSVYSLPVVNALYERAHVRFPVDASLWEDHVEFLLSQNDRSVSLLDLLDRATRHCPWSGDLWSHRILTLEAEGKSREEIEHVKHSATRTGMLEHTDIEEMMKVQIAWCGYLRRKAFDDPQATEDDADFAEIGIRSALELAHQIGTKKYGRDWTGDPKYRLERIHIKFWTQRGNMDDARHLWESLVKKQQDSHNFWYRYYIWEMVVWAKEAVRDQSNAGRPLLPPSRATAVLELAMQRIATLDYPEPLIEMYVQHCEQHEAVLKVRSANIERRRAEQIVAARRAQEKAAAEADSQALTADGHGKRKLEDATEDGSVAKKSKGTEVEDTPMVTPSVEPTTTRPSEAPSEQSVQKRDREHTTIIVSNLPADVTQPRVRRFFTDAGNVQNITIIPEPDQSATATVEFETSEEAEYAVSKAAKGFEGRDITIARGGTTLYVANYPPHADEAYLRRVFGPYGKVLEVRFPSLKFDTHRRFCYVQFASPEEAKAATKLDDTNVGGFKLMAKISNPQAKKKRESAADEGREVYIRRLTYTLKKADIKKAFDEFGKIENINMPTIPNGKHQGNNRGYCFVTYDNKESAEKAVAAMDDKELAGFKIKCEIGKTKNELKPKVKSEIVNTASVDAPKQENPEQAASTDKIEEGEAPADTASTNESSVAPVSARSLALMNVPDTVNDARIKTLIEAFPYKKITLMPHHGGAIVEFVDVSSVGKAGLVLEGTEIAPGRKLRVGTVAELKKEKAEVRPPTSLMAMKPASVRRPVAARGGGVALRGRGKPGLSLVRKGAVGASHTGSGEQKEGAKSNDDFRKMLLGGQTDAEPKEKVDADGDQAMQDGVYVAADTAPAAPSVEAPSGDAK
ncbi:hypothetical protein M011DRAFT_468389 [Sporormia fimetaria CBS 119925]|uniref:U4/U6 snRNA-associated-splicing factor PRP24 n=1 Tax=Sporormia fimetaria CBS 119925 TaxID=1340428 RepID=A0A6A6VAC7_9PLEO|nr:hypothetical protein M011DRAFT_468389 [Sporormia fimetaria CBS 119925]